jgi:LAGLIDADG DNA endonuclease family
MVLGDGCISKNISSINYYYVMEHCIQQEEYADWKKNILNQIGFVKTTKKLTSRNYIRIRTNTCRYFSKIRNVVYTQEKKKSLKYILNYLTPLSLAILYMDDGSLCKLYGRAKLATYGLSYDDNVSLQKLLLKKYKVGCSIYTEKERNVHYLSFNRENTLIFLTIIAPYVNQIECMKYKLYRSAVSP